MSELHFAKINTSHSKPMPHSQKHHVQQHHDQHVKKTVAPVKNQRTFHNNDNQKAWEKFTQQTRQAIDSKDPNSALYPVHQARKEIEKVGGDSLKKAVIASILYLVISNPECYKLLANVFGDKVSIIASTGEVTSTGLILSGVLFFLVYFLISKYVPNLV